MPTTKRPLLFFTGGLDSTAMLYDHLKYHGTLEQKKAIKAARRKQDRRKSSPSIEITETKHA